MTRLGLIGSGYWARTVHGASAKQHPGVELVGVWGRDRTKTEAAAEELATRPYPDLDRLISDVDALTFAVPPDVQAEIAMRAARAGRHLLLEKPVATSASIARELEGVIGDQGLASIVFFTRRFMPEVQAWLARMEDIGGWECGRAEISANILAEGNPFGASPWRHDKGGLWDVGPHALSVILPVLGPVESVVAGDGLRDQVHLVLKHQGGRSSTLSLSLMVPAAATGNSVYVYGENGREVAPVGPFDPVVAHGAALDALIASIGAAPEARGHPCDVHFGTRVVEVLAAAEESIASGRRVTL
jgi:predicted dehydrogenase